MLLSMEQAASILNISVDQLEVLRSEYEIFGYRDGSSWKFKISELERFLERSNGRPMKKFITLIDNNWIQEGF